MKSPNRNPNRKLAESAEQSTWVRVFSTIYRLKVQQMVLILLIAAIVLYGLDFLASQYTASLVGKLKPLPLRALADACFTALIVGFTYEWLVRKEAEGKLAEIISDKLKDQQKVIIEEIPKALLTDRNVMRRTLSSVKVEELIKTGLQVQLGDDQMGNEIYDGLLRKTLSYEEQWVNLKQKVTLSRITDPGLPKIVHNKYYDAIVDYRYDTQLRKTQFLFTCVQTIEEYNTLLRDAKYQVRWLFPKAKEFPTIDETVFEVLRITVGGLDLNIRSQVSQMGIFEAICDHPDLESMLGSTVTVYCRYKVKLNKRGHLLQLSAPYPTKGVAMELDFAETDIHYVNVLDFFVSSQKPMIHYTPSESAPHKIEVELNEWVFPKGGVVFVWVLKKEMSDEFLRPIDSPEPK